MTRDELRDALAEWGWQLERSRDDLFVGVRAVADGEPARSLTATSPERLLLRVADYEEGLMRRTGGPVRIVRGVGSTADMTVRRVGG